MNLYLIRHAEAQALGESGIRDDEERPLTAAGQAQCRPLAKALQQHGVRLDRVLTSPLLRARQTAEGLLKHWSAPMPELQSCDLLAPGGRRRKLTRFLAGLEVEAIAVVGHMPDLNHYAAWLIGSKKAQLELAKGGVVCLHFDDQPDKGAGVLHWLITPEWFGAD